VSGGDYLGQISGWGNYPEIGECSAGLPFKVLFYDDLVGVVTPGHVAKMPLMSFDPP